MDGPLTRLAIVFGGGGSSAVAWEVGVLMGLADADVDTRGADAYIGTSAGSVVSTQLLGGPGIPALFEAACRPVDAASMQLDYQAVSVQWSMAAEGATSAEDARRRIGRFAIEAKTVTAAQRCEEIAQLLPVHDWPDDRQVVTAVSADTGAFRTFTARSGVDLLTAVAASCAVPGVWPPVRIDGEHFMDGAVRSPTNATVAAGFTKVLVVAALLPVLGGGIEREIARLGPDTRAEVIAADERSVATFGPNPLDPRSGPAAARDGRQQGREAADRVHAFLTV